MTDLELSGIIREYVAREVTPLKEEIIVLRTALAEREARIGRLESREIARGERGERGEVGPEGQIGLQGERGSDGINGRDGIDGKPGNPGDVGPQGPAGRDGLDGQPGERGSDGAAGRDGKDGVNGADGARGIDGKDGERGPQGERGADGQNGRDGKDGIDGRSVTIDEVLPRLTEEFKSRAAQWELDFERRAQEVLQRIPKPKDGADGRDGRDGKDALEISEFSLRDDGDGDYMLIAQGRELGVLRLPGVRYRGTFDETREYKQGDGVTRNGSFWIAQKDTPAKAWTVEDWQLAVKSGRDGKPGRDGSQGPKGDPGIDRRYE